MRTTKQEVQGMFKRLLRGMGVNESTQNHNEGWYLEYNAIYGGYKVELIHEDTSVSHPLGEVRRSAKEMYNSLHMACCAIEIKNQDIKHDMFERRKDVDE